jgi:hypothetical protein
VPDFRLLKMSGVVKKSNYLVKLTGDWVRQKHLFNLN